MIRKNQILKLYGENYKEMTKQLLRAADLAGRIPSKETVIGMKPNLVCPTPADYGATTHPEIIAGIIEYLQENGYRRILIAEGSWVGDRTSDAYEYCGYRALSETYGVPFIDTKKESAHAENCAGMDLKITDVTKRIGFLINVPVMKGHCQTKVTCALKNMKGLLPDSEKRRFHRMGLHKPIAHLATVLKPDFIVTDHICGDLDFEEGGNPVVRNCIMVSLDPVLTDSYVCSLMNYTPDDVPYVRLAEKRGCGSADLAQAEIICLNGAGEEEQLPVRRRILDVAYLADEVDSCSACYGNLIPALCRLKEEGLLENLKERIAIGQGHRGKHGVLGVGQCTKGFDVSVPGCPPDEETIYQGLKAYLSNK